MDTTAAGCTLDRLLVDMLGKCVPPLGEAVFFPLYLIKLRMMNTFIFGIPKKRHLYLSFVVLFDIIIRSFVRCRTKITGD